MQTSEISQAFLEFYRGKGFSVLPGAPLLHPLIPASFVMSAGLVEIELALSDQTARPGERHVVVQRCFRHFDIPQIGSSYAHLSLFEMPGSFVFGPIDRDEAIQDMWQLLTEVLGLPQIALWITYSAGGDYDNHRFPEDVSTKQAWLDLGVERSRLLARDHGENLWLQGGGIDNSKRYRKSGPNTEIFYDRGEELACDLNCMPGCGCGRFVEISSAVFADQELDAETGRLQLMKMPFCETVVGSERVAMILQGKSSVFGTSAIAPLVKVLNAYDVPNRHLGDPFERSKQIVIDHVRAIYYLVADHAPRPGSRDRQRIMRKLIRSVLTQQILLDVHEPTLLSDMLTVLAERDHQQAQTGEIVATVMDYFEQESDKFRKTLRRGERQIDRWLNSDHSRTLSGAQILSLEKEYGVPHELTGLMLDKRGLPFAQEEYGISVAQWRKQLDKKAKSSRRD